MIKKENPGVNWRIKKTKKNHVNLLYFDKLFWISKIINASFVDI